jgi:putative SOS response-associated peptidase YedK
MCGRYAITTAPEVILRLFKIAGTAPNLPPHYNAAPGQDLPVIRLHPAPATVVSGYLLLTDTDHLYPSDLPLTMAARERAPPLGQW